MRFRKLLGRLGFSYCTTCGDKLWFDDEKWNMGYNVHSVCLGCKENK